MTVLLLGRVPRSAAERRLLERAAKAALGRQASKAGELCVVFQSDAQIRELNRRFLKKDRPTDVLAFRYDDAFPGAGSPFGDVFIGLGAARRQARALGHSLRRELVTLVVHGVLHLLGHDDLKPAAKKRMFKAQDRLADRLLSREED